MDRLAKEAGRERPMVGAIPYMSSARTVEEGAKQLNLKQLCASMVKQFILPPSGTFETVEDIDGAAIAGPPDVIVEQINKFHAAGVEHFVFDLRTRFAEFEELIELIGSEVLPVLRRES